jgi:hypothetical protein
MKDSKTLFCSSKFQDREQQRITTDHLAGLRTSRCTMKAGIQTREPRPQLLCEGPLPLAGQPAACGISTSQGCNSFIQNHYYI